MSANTLVAFCVGCLFLLALATVVLAFLSGIGRQVRHEDESERDTKAMPQHGWPQGQPED